MASVKIIGLCLILTLVSSVSYAGSYTYNPNQGQLVTGVSYSQVDKTFESSGKSIDNPGDSSYKKTSLTTLLEYGLRQNLSLSVYTEYLFVSDTSVSGETSETSGFGDFWLGLKYRFFSLMNLRVPWRYVG